MPFADFFMGRSSRLLLAVFLTLVMLACRPAPPPPGVVATTDLGEIHRIELDEHILSLPEARRSPPAGQPLPEWRHQMLEELIVTQALETEARSLGLAETEEARVLLTSRRDAILAEVMSSRLIGEKVEVTEDDLLTFYDAHPGDFSHPAQIRLRNIFRRVARDASPELWETARQEMEGLLGEIHRGAHFGDLARAHSDSETAALGGLIGRLDRGQLDPAIEEILWNLDEGEASGVIRTAVGFHIFKVEKYLGHFKMDFEDARTRLARRLIREATEAAEATVLQELLEASGATYAPAALKDGIPEAVLFALGDDSMTVADLHQYLDSMGFSAARELPIGRQLDRIVSERLYLWKAEELGLAGEPEIGARLEQLEREVLIALALRERTRAQFDVLKEKDLQDSYESRKERFYTPRLMHLRILTLGFPKSGNWYSVYEELDRLAGEIRAGRRDFADAARALSTDFTAVGGGDVGNIRAEALADWAGPQAQRKVTELAVGDISGPIMIERYNSNRLTYERTGYMLVRLEGIEEARIRPLWEVRDTVIQQYMEQGGEEIQRQVQDDILRSVDTEIYEENL